MPQPQEFDLQRLIARFEDRPSAEIQDAIARRLERCANLLPLLKAELGVPQIIDEVDRLFWLAVMDNHLCGRNRSSVSAEFNAMLKRWINMLEDSRANIPDSLLYEYWERAQARHRRITNSLQTDRVWDDILRNWFGPNE